MAIETSPYAGYAAQVVIDKYNKSVELANAAMKNVQSAANAFNTSIYTPPQISVQWTTLAAPALPPIPEMPELPEVTINDPGEAPGALTATLVDVAIDDFDVTMPTLNFGTAPTITIGSAPAIPQVNDVALPDVPVIALPDVPQFLTLQTPTFGGINLREEWLDKLSDIPELTLSAPTRFEYAVGQRYGSQLLESLKAGINARIHGGSGIAPAVEQQLWDRARDRETQLALAREQEVLRSAESLGFSLPSGVMLAQLADARREYQDKLSSLSRDIAIKQAELEQENVKNAIQAALQLEGTLIDEHYKFEQLVFEAAKVVAEQSIAAINANIEQYKALLGGFQTYASTYDTIMRGELSKVEVFKALLSAEETKSSINKSLVERYKAEIEGRMTAVELYKARVGAAQTLMEVERTRIQAGAERVKAFVATVEAETSKAEMYKAQVSAEAAKVGAVEAVARAYSAKVGAQAEKARIEIAKLQAHVSVKGMEWEGWKAKVSASAAKVDADAKIAGVLVDGYKIGAAASEAQAASLMRRWEADIKQYEASQSLTFQAAKANADAVMHTNDARLEAAKVSLATSAQQVASAWSMVSASAQIDSGYRQSHGISFNYSGDVSSDVSPQT